jgi:hypothetical protein
MGDLINGVMSFFHQVVAWFQTVVPGGFGILLIPLAVFGIISLLVARRR